ncbi:MAG: type II toxin-antitoxin system VapC family toxin [Chloroflexi bacterium]|nr:MAG: type II toxin-antitoxin system VapC family toxin [Chloroflexota bacterium]
MIAADTSVLVAAFATWHESHRAASRALRPGTRLIAQCAVETYSVLTRLPPPHRAPADVVFRFLAERFPEDYLVLDSAALKAVLRILPRLGITGGATYDAVIGATAARAGATLLSFDRRAAGTYERSGCDLKLLV